MKRNCKTHVLINLVKSKYRILFRTTYGVGRIFRIIFKVCVCVKLHTVYYGVTETNMYTQREC